MISIHSFTWSIININPLLYQELEAICFLGNVSSNLTIWYSTFLANFSSLVIKIDWAFSSCSAWDNKSIAIHSGLFLLSATIKTSEGPATESIPTLPNNCLLASAT